MLIRRLLATLAVAGAGAATATLLDLGGLWASSTFFTVASALLAIGLFASTSSIAPRTHNLRSVAT